jgi:hypothetical protein
LVRRHRSGVRGLIFDKPIESTLRAQFSRCASKTRLQFAGSRLPSACRGQEIAGKLARFTAVRTTVLPFASAIGWVVNSAMGPAETGVFRPPLRYAVPEENRIIIDRLEKNRPVPTGSLRASQSAGNQVSEISDPPPENPAASGPCTFQTGPRFEPSVASNVRRYPPIPRGPAPDLRSFATMAIVEIPHTSRNCP